MSRSQRADVTRLFPSRQFAEVDRICETGAVARVPPASGWASALRVVGLGRHNSMVCCR